MACKTGFREQEIALASQTRLATQIYYQKRRIISEKYVRITPSQVKPALLTMMWILPPPNSAAFFTSSSMYCAFDISPGIAVACPPPSSMALATAFALSIHQRSFSFYALSRNCTAPLRRCTGIYILDHNFCALLSEQSRSFCPNALS